MSLEKLENIKEYLFCEACKGDRFVKNPTWPEKGNISIACSCCDARGHTHGELGDVLLDLLEILIRERR